MHACFDALMTVFKGHLVAAACVELQPLHLQLQCFDVATKIVEKFTIVSEAFRIVRIECTIMPASLAMDAWSEGDGPRVLRCWKVLLLMLVGERSMHWRLYDFRSSSHRT